MISYQEFKTLNDEQKAETLKELKKMYLTNKEMGAAWGVSPLVISNLYKKYVEGLKVGRKPKKEREDESETDRITVVSSGPQDQVAAAEMVSEKKISKARKRRGRIVKDENKKEYAVIAVENAGQADSDNVNRDFNLTINSQMDGDAARKRFSAMADLFLSDKKYKITLEIKEI